MPYSQKHIISVRDQHTHLMQNENMPFVLPSPLILKCLKPRAAPNSWNTTCYSKTDIKVLSLFIKNKTIPLFLTSFVSITWTKIDGLVFFIILHWILHYTVVMMKSWDIHKKQMYFLPPGTLVKNKHFYKDIFLGHT